MMPVLAGMRRSKISDFGTSELDIALSYASQETSTEATIYLFRPALASVPIWFDRAKAALEGNRTLFPSGVTGGAPTTFVAEAAGLPGLKGIYSINGVSAGSTGVAMVSVGQWVLAVRITSGTLAGPQLDRQLTGLLGSIRFPANIAKVAVQVMQDCAGPLKFGAAKQLRQADSDSMMEALMGAAIAADPKIEANSGPPEAFCRDPSSTLLFGVYRGSNPSDSYTIALGDGGESISVGPSLAGLFGVSRTKRYAVTQHHLDRDLVFSPYNKLPDPASVVKMVLKATPISMTERGSNSTSITISK